MGLCITFDAFNGPYSSFNNWRAWLFEKAGYSDLESMDGFTRTGDPGTPFPNNGDPLFALINHSDCDGIIEYKNLESLWKRLDTILTDTEQACAGQQSWRLMFDTTWDFILGAKKAIEAKADLEFR